MSHNQIKTSLSFSQQLFFELLQISLGTRAYFSRVPSAHEWTELLMEAQRQTVVSFLTDGLEKLQRKHLPTKDLLLHWIGQVQISDFSYSLYVERAKELTTAFASAGFETCILKGLSAAGRYPNPSRRQEGDIDLWVNGPIKEVMQWLKEQCKVGPVVWHHVDAKFFEDVPVEIHFHPIWLYNPRHNILLQKWFDEKGRVLFKQPIGEQGFVSTSADFDAVYQLVHCFHHLLEEGLGVRHVVDYYNVLRSLSVEDRLEALNTLQIIGLERFVAAMMFVLKEACGMSDMYLLCEPNLEEGKFLLDEIVAGGNFGKTRTDGLTRNTFGRWWVLLRHYPTEVLWMVPWKIWHKGWRMTH